MTETKAKPRARSGGRRPRAKGPSSADRQGERRASESRRLLKARVLSLEAHVSTIQSLLDQILAEIVPVDSRHEMTEAEWLSRKK